MRRDEYLVMISPNEVWRTKWEVAVWAMTARSVVSHHKSEILSETRITFYGHRSWVIHIEEVRFWLNILFISKFTLLNNFLKHRHIKLVIQPTAVLVIQSSRCLTPSIRAPNRGSNPPSVEYLPRQHNVLPSKTYILFSYTYTKSVSL